MAYEKKKGRPHFFLRESLMINNRLTFRNLYDLGPDPSAVIIYPGGNAFYFDEKMEDALSAARAVYDSDELEELFRPWLRPDIRQAIEHFMNRSSRALKKKLTEMEKEEILRTVPNFDKRRAHYLKFGNMDQGPVENMPPALFSDHIHKSRDEIEQRFFREESNLNTRDLKSYVYTVFNLQRFFQGLLAKRMPQAMDQDRVDEYFLSEICRINRVIYNRDKELDDHLIRYMIMFFDHTYDNSTLLDDLANDFMNRHRDFRPRPVKSINLENACKIFHITREELKTMTQKHLARRYRKLARQVHPDTGGSHEKFVELNNAYETLLEKLK
ncbi:MAG: DnaJ domain-containing protein [Desulfobacula sp.]|jgi:hypothetical protein